MQRLVNTAIQELPADSSNAAVLAELRRIRGVSERLLTAQTKNTERLRAAAESTDKVLHAIAQQGRAARLQSAIQFTYNESLSYGFDSCVSVLDRDFRLPAGSTNVLIRRVLEDAMCGRETRLPDGTIVVHGCRSLTPVQWRALVAQLSQYLQRLTGIEPTAEMDPDGKGCTLRM